MFQHCHNLKKTVTHDSSVSLHLVPQRTHTSVCSLWHFSVPLHASYRGVKWVGQMSGFYNLYLVSKRVTHLTITCCGFICTPGICRVWMQPLEQLEECGLIKITTEVARMRVWDLNLAQMVIQPHFPSQRVWRSGSVAEQHHWRSVRLKQQEGKLLLSVIIAAPVDRKSMSTVLSCRKDLD